MFTHVRFLSLQSKEEVERFLESTFPKQGEAGIQALSTDIRPSRGFEVVDGSCRSYDQPPLYSSKALRCHPVPGRLKHERVLTVGGTKILAGNSILVLATRCTWT